MYKRTIKIKCYHNPGESHMDDLEIEAICLNNLAIHQSILLDQLTEGWTITHIDTGLALIGERLERRDLVVRVAKELDALFDDMPPLKTNKYNRWVKGVKPTVKEWTTWLDKQGDKRTWEYSHSDVTGAGSG